MGPLIEFRLTIQSFKTEKLIYLFLHNNLSLFADQYITDKKSIALKV